MDIYQTIIDVLKSEYAAGATYQELSQKYGVSYQYIRELLLGNKPVKRVSLETFFKLFPRATVELNAGNAINGGRLSARNIQVGNNFFNDSSSVLQDICQEVMASKTLSAESKVEVYNIIEAHKK